MLLYFVCLVVSTQLTRSPALPPRLGKAPAEDLVPRLWWVMVVVVLDLKVNDGTSNQQYGWMCMVHDAGVTMVNSGE